MNRVLNECKKCGWQWFARGGETPRICPKCKSTFWQIGRQRKRKSGSENDEGEVSSCEAQEIS